MYSFGCKSKTSRNKENKKETNLAVFDTTSKINSILLRKAERFETNGWQFYDYERGKLQNLWIVVFGFWRLNFNLVTVCCSCCFFNKCKAYYNENGKWPDCDAVSISWIAHETGTGIRDVYLNECHFVFVCWVYLIFRLDMRTHPNWPGVYVFHVKFSKHVEIASKCMTLQFSSAKKRRCIAGALVQLTNSVLFTYMKACIHFSVCIPVLLAFIYICCCNCVFCCICAFKMILSSYLQSFYVFVDFVFVFVHKKIF